MSVAPESMGNGAWLCPWVREHVQMLGQTHTLVFASKHDTFKERSRRGVQALFVSMEHLDTVVARVLLGTEEQPESCPSTSLSPYTRISSLSTQTADRSTLACRQRRLSTSYRLISGAVTANAYIQPRTRLLPPADTQNRSTNLPSI